MILRHPQALLLLLLLPAFIAVWQRRRALSGVALTLRLLIVVLVVLALANPTLRRSGSQQDILVLLVDQSDSLGDDGKALLRRQAATIAGAYPDRARILYFGGDVVAAEVGADERDAAPQPSVSADSTDIAGALRLARSLIGTRAGRIVLLSDGVQTRGDALAEAGMLARARIPVDSVVYQPADRPELWVARVEAPRTLREGETYETTIVIGSSRPTTARLALFEGSLQLVEEDVQLVPGENSVRYRSQATTQGMLGLRAVVEGRLDTFEYNNSAAATILVAPPPRVLLVESRPGAAWELRAALRPAGIDAEIVAARDLSPQLSTLAAYDGIVLVDVPAVDLSLDRMAALREFVRSEGRGLVVTGGRSSFTLGNYKNTPLEEVLPVSMTPPSRPERPPVTLLLIIDQSASMYGTPGRSKLDMAKEAAILATETLEEEDRLGVLTFDTSARWTVEFQMLGTGLSLVEIQEQIGRIATGGGTNIYAALETGLQALADQPGEVRHAVLLTDGKSAISDPSRYRTLIEQARAQDITLSTIAIGDDSDTLLLQELAQLGAGRYHCAGEPEDIPRLTLQESEIARSEPQVEGSFRADLAEPHPLVRGYAAGDLPPLEGYVATTIKPEAELVLISPEEDPLLAVWQYGLGRAVAWTPSVAMPWAEPWQSWPDYGAFWAQVIRYTLPEPGSGPLQVRVTPEDDTVTISAESLEPGGEPLDLADTEATIRLPDGSESRLRLRQVAPGRYVQNVALPVPGPYAIEVRQRKGAEERVAWAGYVHRYPDEYLPTSGAATLLEQISAVTGGSPQALTGDQLPLYTPAGDARGLWPWLLLAAALLWPLEVAVRRGWLAPGSRR